MRVRSSQIKLLPLLCILLVTLACSRNEKPTSQELEEYIGEIRFDSEMDTSDFELCYEKPFFIYSPHTGLGYKGEKPAIVEKFQEYENLESDENGYITIRFLVNCKGKAGRYRVIEMDQNYELKEFSPSITKQLLAITQSLQEWEPGVYEGQAYDYHQYLTFKIDRGNLKEVLP